MGTKSVYMIDIDRILLELTKLDELHFLIKLYYILYILFFMTNFISIFLL